MLIGIGKGSVNVDDLAHGIGNPKGWSGTGSGNFHCNCTIHRIDMFNDVHQEMWYVFVMLY